MAYQFPLEGGRINALVGGNSTSAGAGYSLISSGTMLLAGGNNITLSQNGSAITISGANAPSGSINFSASNTSANLASVTFSNSNGVSFGLNAGVITASYNGLTSQSNQALSASNGSFAFQTAGFSNANGVTFGTSAGSIMTASVNTSYAASNHSHGNPTLNLTNISGTTASASNGLTLSLSAAAQSVQTQNVHNFTLAGNSTSAGAGYAQISSGTLTLAGGNNITLSQNGNAITISGGAGGAGGVAIANSQATYTSGTINLLEGGGAITIASTTGQKYNFSVPAQSSLSVTGALSISRNASTISIGVPAFSAGMSNIGNTQGTSGTASNQIIFAGGNNITLSQSTGVGGNTVSIIGGAGGGGGGGIALANSQTTYTSGTANLAVAGGAMTIASTTGQSLNFSVPATSSLSATGIVSIATNGGTISIGASVPKNTMDYYQNMDRGATSTVAVPFASMMLQRLNQENDLFAANLTANTVLINMTANMTATSLSSAHTVSASIGIYSDNITNISLLNSASTTWTLGAATNNTASYHGPRWLSFVSSQWSSAPVFSQGGDYVFGIIVRSSSYAPPISFYGQNYMQSNQRSGVMGSSIATNATMAQGNYWNAVVNTAALPASVAASQAVRNNASAVFIPHIILNNRYSGTF